MLSGTVFAHGGETFFVAEPAMVAPGGGVGVRADVLTSGPVRLSLAGTDGSFRLVGVVEETEDGHFEVFIEIPADLPTGHWTLLAEADGTAIASTTLEVAGAAIDADLGGQGPRDEEDPLLVPLPSGWRASRSTPLPTTPSPAVGTRRDPIDVVPLLSLCGAVVALTLLVVRTRPRRSSRDPSDDPR